MRTNTRRMTWSQAACWLLVGLALAAAPQAQAQLLPQARLYALQPSGGQRGTSVDVVIANGTDLDEARGLVFSNPAITAKPKVDANGQPVANQFTVTLPADLPVGQYDARISSVFGLSNPRTFVVGDRPEVAEVEPNNEVAKAQALAMNSVVNGRSDGGTDLDHFKVTLKTGERVLFDCRARRMDSRMAPVMDLLDGAGRKLVTARRNARQDAILDYTATADGDYIIRLYDSVYGGGADHFYRLTVTTGPLIDFVMPSSVLPGQTAEVTLYGRGLPGGQPSPFKTAGGKPLDMLKVQVTAPADGALFAASEPAGPAEGNVSGFSYSLASPTGSSNAVTIYLAQAPTTVEIEPNDAAAQAQKLVVPAEVTGNFATRGDADLYAFDAQAGQILWIDVHGQRNGGQTDPYFAVQQVTVNEKGEEKVTQMTLVDDNPTNLAGNIFNTQSDDPAFRFVAPAAGLYRVVVRDRYSESRGDPALTYRLVIREETPDFRLVAIPQVPTADLNLAATTWDISLRKNDTTGINVLAYRLDGYTGPIDVTVEGLPAGVTTKGTTIGANQNSAILVLASAADAAEFAGLIKLVGKARIENPAANKAVTDAEAAAKAAQTAIPPLDKPITDAQAVVKTATDNLAKAVEALAKDENNEGLKKAKADAETALAAANEKLKAATDAKAAAEAKLAAANATVAEKKAARDAAVKDVVREARGGTIVWNGNQQLASQARVARSIGLSVIKETAPFKVAVEGERKFEVNQGRQIVLPVQLARAPGFDQPVAFTFVAPPQNVQVENKPIEKDKTSGQFKLVVPNNVAPGTYTFLLQGQGPISYRRHGDKADQAAAEKAAADKALADAMEALKKANEAKAASDKKVTDTAAAAKKAADDKPVADKAVTDADAAAKTAKTEKDAADKVATDADAANKAALVEKEKTDKAFTDAEAAKKAADEAATKAKTEADAKTDDKALQDAKAAAEKAAADAAEALKKATEAKAANDKKAADAAEALKKANDAKVAADGKLATATENLKKATDAKAVADKAVVDTVAVAKVAVEEQAAAIKKVADTTAAQTAAQQVKVAADKKATDTANVAKPQAINLITPAEAITLIVKQGPGTLATAPGNGGKVGRGSSVEVKVTINRANGFAGPVKLSLPLPPGVAGLTAQEVEIPADKNEGVLVIMAAGDATQGAIANLAVRASMEFNGPAAIDGALALTVE